jgi:hypothetical protein
MENCFFEQFQQDLWMLGNNHYYGFNTETLEERGNELLKKQKNIYQEMKI